MFPVNTRIRTGGSASRVRTAATQPAADDLSFLDDRHSGDLIRLKRLLEHPSRFRLVLAEHNAPRYRDRIIAELADRFPDTATSPLAAGLSASALIEHLRELATRYDNGPGCGAR